MSLSTIDVLPRSTQFGHFREAGGMTDPLPPRGGLSEWTPTSIAAVFLAIGTLLGAVLYWGADQLLLDEQDPATEVVAPTTTTTSSTVPAAPAPTAAPATEPPAEQPDDGGAARDADRKAQSDLRNAITAAKSIATDYEGRFQKNAAGEPIDPAALKQENPALEYAPGGSAAVGVVSVTVESADGPNSHIWLITKSSTGLFYCVGGTVDGEISRTTGDSEQGAKAICHSGAAAW